MTESGGVAIAWAMLTLIIVLVGSVGIVVLVARRRHGQDRGGARSNAETDQSGPDPWEEAGRRSQPRQGDD